MMDYKNDEFDELKQEIIIMSLYLETLKYRAIFLVKTNCWILEDINLCESFYHLIDMFNISNYNLKELVNYTILLDTSDTYFSIFNLLDEVNFIKDNILLESTYLTNISEYINITINPKINGNLIVKKLDKYLTVNTECYEKMIINNEEVKRLRKERRD